MVIAYVVAGLFAAVAAVGAIRDPRVPYWWRWDRTGLARAVGVICLIYAGNGLLVTALAEHFGVRVLHGGSVAPWVNGLIYGLAAFLLLRWDVVTLGFAGFTPARVLVDLFLEQFGGWLDVGAERGVKRAVGDLKPPTLCCVSLQAYLLHVEPELTDDKAKGYLAWLYGEFEQMWAEGEPDDSDAAWGSILAVERVRWSLVALIVDNPDATIDLREEPRSSLARVFRWIGAARKRFG